MAWGCSSQAVRGSRAMPEESNHSQLRAAVPGVQGLCKYILISQTQEHFSIPPRGRARCRWINEVGSLCCSLPGGCAPSAPCSEGHGHQACPKTAPTPCARGAQALLVLAWLGTCQTWLGYLNISYSWLLAFRENKLILFHVPRNGPHQTAFLHSWLSKVCGEILGVLLLGSQTI